MSTTPYSTIRWQEAGIEHVARWRSEAGVGAPEMMVVADDTLKADAAYRLAAQGTAILWRGDYQNARNLLQALARRVDRGPREVSQKKQATPAAAFHLHRQAQGRRAAILGRLLVPLTADYRVPLRRGQEVAAACQEALGPGGEDSVISLRGLLALVSAHEWRKKGIPVPAVAGRIYPHFGVFSPVRGECVDLVAQAPLPAGCDLAFDIGTGSGILALVLARRGVARVIATDQDPRALACAPAIEPEHLLSALIAQEGGVVPSLLKRIGTDTNMLQNSLQQALGRLPRATGSSVQVSVSRNLNAVVEEAQNIADNMKDDYVSTEHLLMAMAQPKAGSVRDLLARHGIDTNAIMQALAAVRGSQRVTSQNPEAQYEALVKYGRNLTQEARKGKLDPVIGRDEEIRRVIQILSRRTKNNP